MISEEEIYDLIYLLLLGMELLQAVFISMANDGILVWDGYKTTTGSPAVTQVIKKLSLPPKGFLLDELHDLTREPWYRRTNLTGLVLRCSTLNVRNKLWKVEININGGNIQ